MKKFLFNKVCIVGVGLIGGSLGLAVKKRKLAKLVVGVVRREKSAIEAVQRKAVDMATLDLKEGVHGADLVILCASVSAILQHLKTIYPYVGSKTIVIDVGSSKSQICQVAERYFNAGARSPRSGRGNPAPTFVGCHPMAGSEKCGIEFADVNLFEDSLCFMTQKNRKVETFWRELGSRPLRIGSDRHDIWVAKSSHLPHALSFALFQNMDSKYSHNPSLKDMARLANSDAGLWADIFLSNQREVLKATREFQKNLSRFQKTLRVKNKASLVQFIRHANKQAS